MLKWLRRGGGGSPDCALDMGSSTVRLSAAAGSRQEACAVLWDLSSQAPVEWGDRAWERIGRHPEHWTLLRPVRGGALADFDAAEGLCRWLLTSLRLRPHLLAAAACQTGEPELQHWGDMLREAGAASVTLVPATACALLGHQEAATPWNERVACAGLEAGSETLQASVYSRGRAVFHWQKPGGAAELCLHLTDHFLRRHFLHVGSGELRRLLPQLALPSWRGDDSRWLEVKGRDMQSGLPRVLSVAPWELDRCLELCIAPLRELLTSMMEETPPELLQQLLEDGVSLSGGLAGLQGLPEWLHAQVGLPVTRTPGPADAVIRGLARMLNEPRTCEALLN